jgi:hypothetical protein
MTPEQEKCLAYAKDYAKSHGIIIKESIPAYGGPGVYEVSSPKCFWICGRMTPEHLHGFMLAVINKDSWG